MKSIIRETGERRSPRPWQKADNRLRTMCDGLSPKKRLVVVISSLIVFAVMAVYMAVSSVYGINNPKLKIEHIEGLKLHKDSINQLKSRNYDEHNE